ncbi:MAG: Ca-activated chloride channel [Blastocatellia bacterium]|jgi:VWFA-related protein|nr:Ca-activated chloride channel [Blastocatellia bacterium]
MKVRKVLILLTSILVFSQLAVGQSSCLTPADVQRMLAQINMPQRSALPNKSLTSQLIKLKLGHQEGFRNATEQTGISDDWKTRTRTSRENITAQLCPLLKNFGWPTIRLVGKDGVAAAFYLLKNSSSFELQRDLLPVVIAAVKRNEIAKSEFAGYIDQLRLRSGLKQIFGTKATVADGFLVLFPIEGEAQVDVRRTLYDLPPLREYLKSLELIYQMPLVKSTGSLTNQFADSSQGIIARQTANEIFEGELVEEAQVVRVDTNLVSLNVSVYSNELRTQVSTLGQQDFTVSEDGFVEAITFFANTAVPFDLVLLIDLSGSTTGNRDLIRDATRSFVKAARPLDRLAIVTFSDTATIISPLTEDRNQLLQGVEKMRGEGGSHIWDSLKFVLDKVLGPKMIARRRAVVLLTDGIDNSLPGSALNGRGDSLITFADLVESVRHNDTLIIPIYLNHETGFSEGARLFQNARNTLALLAEESGGLYYEARRIQDLKDVYSQVIEDLGNVYSLGYRPTNQKSDGSWRTVTIKIPGHPELKPRTRPGYYAKKN